MYKFTTEIYNEDTNKLEYHNFEINEGDQCTDREGREMIITSIVDGNCPYICENGDADLQEMWSDSELSRYFAPVSIDICD